MVGIQANFIETEARPLFESDDGAFRIDASSSGNLPAGALVLCLNLSGSARLQTGKTALDLEPLTAALCWSKSQPPTVSRSAGDNHRSVTIIFSRKFLRRKLSPNDGALHPLVEEAMRGNGESSGAVQRLTSQQEQCANSLLAPPVPVASRALWYEAKTLELVAEFFFQRADAGELFCERQKRIARDRAAGVIALLHKHLAEPLSLEEIGRQVGCSQFHLSRTFSRETGMTIPQYLRKIRIEKAAELLRTGNYNVTEAAMEVGYSSLSHFSQAFCQTMGCCPGLYPPAGAI